MPTDHLPARLMRAFERLDPATPVPDWPRSVRIGVDYSLRVTGMDPQTDAEADSLAYTCFVLGNLAKRDPPGDPPATVTAQERAARGGAGCARAFDVLGQVRDGSAEWARRGWPVPTLADRTTRILQRAARGEHVQEDVLTSVLEAAEHVAQELGWRLLAADPVDTARFAGLNQRHGA
jgi:hypothetical protein